jgi:hypothetical protein
MQMHELKISDSDLIQHRHSPRLLLKFIRAEDTRDGEKEMAIGECTQRKRRM